MKIASPLALITIFAAAASAFGLNGAPKGITKVSTTVGVPPVAFTKKPMVQAVDVEGNPLSSSVSLADHSVRRRDCFYFSGLVRRSEYFHIQIKGANG